MSFSVLDISRYPNAVVCTADTLRGAQIIARELGHRFPDAAFGYCDWVDFGLPEADAPVRVAAAAVEILNAMLTELAAERRDNPGDLPKWLVFRFTDGISTYLEHDRAVILRCLANPALVEVLQIYSEHPTLEEMLAMFAQPTNQRRAATAR